MESMGKREFVSLLTKAKEKIESENLSYIEKGEDFEDYVYNTIKQLTAYPVKQTGKQTFPDIIVDGYGIEVKFSKSNKWESLGNSIFEGTHTDEVTKDIYVFFGKKVNNSKVEIRFDLYVNCLSDVKITHSPRFYINMELPKDKSVLRELGVSYSVYKDLNPKDKGKMIRRYLKQKLKEGEMVWWMDEEERAPIIKKYSSLPESEQSSLRTELFVLFPEIFKSGNNKYQRAQLYLLNKHQVTFSRDMFSASGQVDMMIKGELVKSVPRIFQKLYESAPSIKDFIDKADSDILYEYWEDLKIVSHYETKENKIAAWLKQIDRLSQPLPGGYKPSDVFKEGIKSPLN